MKSKSIFSRVSLLTKCTLATLVINVLSQGSTEAQTCSVGSAVSSTGYGYIAWGGSAHAQNATKAYLASGSTLTPTNSAILQDETPLIIDMQRLVSGGSTFTFAVQRFNGGGNADATIEYSTNGTTWASSSSGWGAAGASSGIRTTSGTSQYITRTVPSGGLRYVRITSTSSPNNNLLIDGVGSTHYCPVSVSGTRATRSFYAPGTNKGSLRTNVYPANAQTLEFTTVTTPGSGTWSLNSTTGAYSYIPSPGFDGFSIGTYKVCDGGADGNLATTGDNICDTDTILLRAVFNCDTNVFYAPIPEDQAMDFLQDIDRTGGNTVPVNVYMGFSVTSDAVVTYDHWEDGFETNPRNPTQSTTQIWGDGDLSNGIAPGTTDDILRGGTTMLLQNLILAINSSGLNVVDYDGRDKIFVHGIGALSKLDWGSVATLSVSGAAVPRTEYWGTDYTIPAGQNTPNNGTMFQITSASIIASTNSTTVDIDIDRNGTTDISVTLNEGETYYLDSRTGTGNPSTLSRNVLQGATIKANKPIQVMYMTGRQGNSPGTSLYGGRTFPLVPDAQLSTCYIVPAVYGISRILYLYNPTASTITITRTAPGGATTTFNIAANSSASQSFAVGGGDGYEYCSGSSAFTMIACVDDGNAGNGVVSDWGFVPTSAANLQQITLMSLGFGQDPTVTTAQTRNYEQLLVTPTTNTYFYVDFDGDKVPDKFCIGQGNLNVTETAVTIGGGSYNETTSDNGVLVQAFRTLSISAPNGNMAGAYVWTKTTTGNTGSFGGEFAAIYGQNDGSAAASPNIDAGYNLPPKILPPLNATVRVRFPNVCPGSTTDSIHFNITAGASPYRIQWINLATGENSVYNFTADSTQISGIKPGTYIVKIRDNNCLNFQTTITISQKTIGCPVSISGKVYDDGDGNYDGAIDGDTLGIAGGTQLYAYLDSAGFAVRKVAIPNSGANTGAFTFKGAATGSNYTVVISGTSVALMASTPASLNVTNWVSTGESYGTNNSAGTGIESGTANSRIAVNLGGVGVAGIKIGLDERPTSDNLTAPSQANPGGTNTVVVPALSGGDLEDGVGVGKTLPNNTLPSRTIIISTIPGNGFLYYNGNPTALTAGKVIANYDPTLLRVDPNFSGAGNVVFTYAWRDSAQATDLTPATVTLPFTDPAVTLSGTVYDDGNGLNAAPANTVDGTGLGNPSSTTLYANLLDAAGTTVVATTTVNTNGTYSFPTVNVSTNYIVQISTVQGTVSAATPTKSLPTNWVNTGENLGAGAGNDGTANGLLPVAVSTSNITNANFGIDVRPYSDSFAMTAQANPGIGNYVTVSTLSGSDKEDGAKGSGNTLVVTSLATGGTLSYNGSAVTLNQVITNYDPTLLKVTPNFSGAGTVTFKYAWRDAAGFDDLTPATVDVPFLGGISGTVFDDGNGLNAAPANTVDGSGLGNPSSTTLYANLLNSTGTTVVATTTVNTNGTYSFSSLVAGNYQVQVSTNQGTVSAATPATALPTNWVNTGENLGAGAGNDGTVNGILTGITLGTTAVSNANFGIDVRPYSDSFAMAAQANPGIGNYVTVSTLSGSDKEDGAKGSGNTLVVTSLATGGTLSYNGSAVTLNQVITNYDPTLLKVTPNFSGAGTVTFKYAWRDAAGFDDLTPATVDVPFLGGISGTVFDDGNGLNAAPANTVDGSGLGNPSSTTLYANLLNSTGTTVVATTTVNTNGTYSFSSLVAGNYQVQVSTNQGTVSAATPATALPTNWVNTGENLGAGAGNDGTVNGILTGITLGTTAVSNANFGIDERPTSNNLAMTAQANPGIGTYVAVSAVSGNDLEDGTLGSGNTIVITTLASNGTLRYNGSAVTLNQVITNYNPSLLQVTPSFSGAGTVTFAYAWRDAAGFDDLTPATVDVPFLGGISGTVFDDGNGLNAAPANTVDGSGLGNPSSTTLYANLLNSTGTTVVATTTVNTNGTYSFSSLVAGNYQVQVSTNQGTVSAATPATALPTNWVNTGENLGAGAGNDGTVNGILTGITLGTTAVTNANFGIDERPTSNNVSTTSQLNPGGTVQVQGPTLAGNDLEDGSKGSGNTFVITSLGVNGDVYYNGSLVTLNQVISAYNPALLKVDPTFNGAGTVTFTYAWRDTAGFDDLSPATASVPFGALNISGTVHNDYNGVTNGAVDGPVMGSPASTQLWAYLLDATNKVVDSSMVNNTTGAFTFDVANANTSYNVRISSTRTAIGTTGPSGSNLPGSWMNVGESYGTGNNAGSGVETGVSNGLIAANTTTSDITNILFGIEYGTVAEDKTYTVAPDSIKGLTGLPTFTHFIFLNSPSGTADGVFSSSSVAVKPGLISGFDLEEGRFHGSTGGVLDTTILRTLPDTNNAVVVYRYNGQNIFLWPTPSSGDASWQWWNAATSQYEIPNLKADSLILFFKFAYQATTSFQYAYVDASGISGPLATYSLSYTVPLPVVLGDLSCGTSNKGNVVTWSVVDATDLVEMQVYHSLNGAPFTSVSTITNFGNRRESQEYTFVDKTKEMGYHMYKVVATDVSGNRYSTNVCALSSNHAPEVVKITLSPNPTADKTTLVIVTPSEEMFSVDVRDNLGRLVYSQNISVSGTVKATDIDVSNFNPGIYNVRVTWNGHVETFKLLRQ